MGITFGIVTDGNRDLTNVLDSIYTNYIDEFEIIIVGGKNCYPNINHIEFDENIKPGWITKKKNLIVKNSKYDEMVFMHDYILLNKDWYKNYNNNYDICCNKILNKDGSRFRDWCLNELHNNFFRSIGMGVYNRNMIIPYSYNFSKYMYISGSYFLAKKWVMLEFPFDENLVWGQGEDAYWSMNVLQKYNFTMNEKCVVHLDKQKELALNYIDKNDLIIINEYYKRMM